MASLEEMSEDQRNSLALKRLFNHPEVGLEAKRLYKKAVPDLETDDRIKDATKELSAQITKLEQDAVERSFQQTRSENHAKIRAAGLDPEAVEKVMTDERIGNYETAIKYVTGQNRMTGNTPASMTPIRMPDNLKEIQKNPAAWARKEAHNALNDLMAKRG
jgi:hypothetical protein